jgi:hypothetical protein
MGQRGRAIKLLIEIIGWIGSMEVLAAYGLNTYQKIRSDSMTFHLLNLTGGIFLIVYTIHKHAYASAFINLCWVLIALIAIGSVFI